MNETSIIVSNIVNYISIPNVSITTNVSIVFYLDGNFVQNFAI